MKLYIVTSEMQLWGERKKDNYPGLKLSKILRARNKDIYPDPKLSKILYSNLHPEMKSFFPCQKFFTAMYTLKQRHF
jgi:hypothetical protein